MSTTIVIGRESICAGGGHVHISASVDGGAVAFFRFNTVDLLTTPSPDQLEQALGVLLAFHFRGRTKAQANAELQAGITMVI